MPRRALTAFYRCDRQQNGCGRGFCSNLSFSLDFKRWFNQLVGNCTLNNFYQRGRDLKLPKNSLTESPNFALFSSLLLFLNCDDYYSVGGGRGKGIK